MGSTSDNSFFSCSLASAGALLAPLGYSLVEVDGSEALWARREAAVLLAPLPASLAAAWSTGYRGIMARGADFCFKVSALSLSLSLCGLSLLSQCMQTGRY